LNSAALASIPRHCDDVSLLAAKTVATAEAYVDNRAINPHAVIARTTELIALLSVDLHVEQKDGGDLLFATDTLAKATRIYARQVIKGDDADYAACCRALVVDFICFVRAAAKREAGRAA
jgi:hypothetical protein